MSLHYTNRVSTCQPAWFALKTKAHVIGDGMRYVYKKPSLVTLTPMFISELSLLHIDHILNSN
jgi:hypothetical protein